VLPNNNPIQIGRYAKDKSLSLEFLLKNLDLSFLWPIIRKKYSLHGRSYDPKAVFKSLLLKSMRQLSSRRKLTGFLNGDKLWLEKCGFAEPISHNTLHKFIKRVGADSFEEIFHELVNQIRNVKHIGEIVAIDSTLVKGYARDWKNKKCSDPDAAWGYSTTKEWVFGYKVHIACDAESELPIGFTITPANRYDSVEFPNILEDLIKRGIKPKVVIMDAGYDTKENYDLALKNDVVPIIAFNRRNLKKKTTRDFEAGFPIQRNTEQWRSLYSKRSAVERINSRLKEELDLKTLKVRGLDKVKVHAAISLIVMLVVALVAHKSGNGHLSTSVNSFRF
jgi:transposase